MDRHSEIEREGSVGHVTEREVSMVVSEPSTCITAALNEKFIKKKERRMLRVTIELLPGGRETGRRVIATADIARVRGGALADYSVTSGISYVFRS